MAYYIDGNNLIGSIKKKKVGTPEARYWLVHYIQKFQKLKASKIIIFFDGPIDYNLFEISGDVEIVFSSEKEADSLIKKRINSIRYRRDLIVVTRDNEIIYHAKRKRAKIIKPRKFFNEVIDTLEKIEKNKKPKPELTTSDIKLWKNLFNKKKR